jgi:hypothetical protein
MRVRIFVEWVNTNTISVHFLRADACKGMKEGSYYTLGLRNNDPIISGGYYYKTKRECLILDYFTPANIEEYISMWKKCDAPIPYEYECPPHIKNDCDESIKECLFSLRIGEDLSELTFKPKHFWDFIIEDVNEEIRKIIPKNERFSHHNTCKVFYLGSEFNIY